MPVPSYFTTSPVNGGTSIDIAVPPVGGVIYDFVGVNGARVTAYYSAKDLPAFSTDSIVDGSGNGTKLLTSATLSPRAIAALGGGIQEMAVRITISDGDTIPGLQDHNRAFLQFNSVGNVVDLTNVQTYVHDASGNATSSSLQVGFGNSVLETGWWLVQNPTVLTNLYNSIVSSSGKIDLQWQTVNYTSNNALDFQSGLSPSIINYPSVDPDIPLTINLATSSDTGGSDADNITSVTTPVLDGKAAPNEKLEIYSGTTLLGTTTSDSSGDWSLTVPTAFAPDGVYNLTVKALDGSGNVVDTSSALTLTIDTIANTSLPDLADSSDLGSSNSDNITSDTTPTFTGTAEANSTVEIFNGDVSLGTATANGSGVWTFTPSSPLALGSYSIKTVVTDVAGNVSAASEPLNVVINTTGDALLVTVTSINSSDNTPAIAGTISDPSATVKVTVDGTTYDAINNGDGTWRLPNGTITTALPNGTYDVAVTATAGNESATDATTDELIINAVTPPSLSLSSTPAATNGSVPRIVDANLNITGGTLDGARVSVGTNFNANEDRLGIAGQTGTSGAVTVGNETVNWSYNTANGVMTFTGAASSATYQEALRQVTYYSNGTPSGNSRDIQFSLGSTLANPDNGHFYEFVTANGISWTNAKVAAEGKTYFGLQGYLTTVTSADENAFIASKLQGQGWMGASDAATEGDWRWQTGPEAGQPFWLGNGTTGNVVGASYQNWAEAEPNNAGNEDYAHFLANGEWNDYPLSLSNIQGYVVEYGGMPGDPTLQLTGSVTIAIDTTAPSAPAVAPDLDAASDTGSSNTDNITNVTTPKFIGAPGSGTANDTVTLYADGVAVGTGTVAADGSWSVTTSTLSAGKRAIAATFTDPAGNESTKSSELLVEIVTSVPTVPSTPPALSDSSNTGVVKQNNLTNNATPTLGGTGDPGSTFEVFVGNTSLGKATVDSQGKWEFKVPTTLADGTYDVMIKAIDAAGNVSAASPATPLVIDTKPATVKILDYGATVRDSSINAISFQFSEAVNKLDLSDLVLTLKGQPVFLQGATLTSTDNQTWTLSNIPGMTTSSGEYQISVKPGDVTDLAGNLLTVGDSNTWLTGYTADALSPIKLGDGKRGNAMMGSNANNDMRGGVNKDRLKGLGGDDRLFGMGGSDKISGGAGKDYIRGGAGRDRITGGSGNDRLFGNGKHDRLLGGGGKDRLLGGNGDDVLVGGAGNDTLVGGKGKDTFVFNSLKDGVDRIRKFESADDLIDLRSIFKAPQFSADNRFAQFKQYIQLEQVGSSTQVKIDSDGNGSGTTFTTLMTLQNVSVDNVSSTNFILG
ncbi:type I secretion C-terminal target domain-containing protein [Oculatella sp. LEGE 06141]|uniref:Ig-like domain-containing protein n=1 Tax=Oculatella sp. LEGE 06141 TaxID=1828648 RepID=UPI00187EFAD0|nr:Ig-like domain-containing protein [Oculatella sp. LEGE 06141]MBE9180560.1 type I secretion C-terminal target domain-containing protein [Oculatella sp. LEGE 06141]